MAALQYASQPFYLLVLISSFYRPRTRERYSFDRFLIPLTFIISALFTMRVLFVSPHSINTNQWDLYTGDSVSLERTDFSLLMNIPFRKAGVFSPPSSILTLLLFVPVLMIGDKYSRLTAVVFGVLWILEKIVVPADSMAFSFAFSPINSLYAAMICTCFLLRDDIR